MLRFYQFDLHMYLIATFAYLVPVFHRNISMIYLEMKIIIIIMFIQFIE